MSKENNSISTSELSKKLSQIKGLIDDCYEILGTQEKKKAQKRKVPASGKENESDGDYIIGIVNKIKDFDDFEKLEDKVLNKSQTGPKIIMPYYFCYKFFPETTLTTGDIEKITEEFGVRISHTNVAAKIKKDLKKFLTSDTTRAPGKIIRYKLNRKGALYFESLLES